MIEVNPQYNKLIEGKTIALVGGADTINRSFVESSEITIRINSHWAKQRGPIHVLYHSGQHDAGPYSIIDQPEFRDIQFIWLDKLQGIFNSPGFILIAAACKQYSIPLDYFVHGNNQCYTMVKELNPLESKYQWIKDFQGQWNMFAFTGILALEHLRQHPIKKLSVTGMNLFQDHPERLIRKGSHNIEPHINYLRYLQREDSRIIFDTTLSNILENY
jgi:hypothetical protein